MAPSAEDECPEQRVGSPAGHKIVVVGASAGGVEALARLARGLPAIKARGGVAIVQDPADALFPSTPRSALDNVAVDYVLPIGEIAPRLASLVQEPVAGSAPAVSSEIKHREAQEQAGVIREVLADGRALGAVPVEG